MRLIECFSSLISFALYQQQNSVSEQNRKTISGQFRDFIDKSRQTSIQQGFTEYQFDQALFAVVAWIDEQQLNGDGSTVGWVHFLLQKQLFNTTNAGDEFYQRIGDISQDLPVLEVYQYCFALGFRGRLYDDESFQEYYRGIFGAEQNIFDSSLPEPLFPGGQITTGKKRSGVKWFSSVSSAFIMLLISVTLLGGLYFLGRRSLEMFLSTITSLGL